MIAGIAVGLMASVLVIVFLVGAHPDVAERAARRVAGLARRIRPSIDPGEVARASKRLASLTRSALAGRVFAESFAFAAADLLFALLSLDLMFLTVRQQPGLGPWRSPTPWRTSRTLSPSRPAGWE
jgi:hypothetical protein